MPSTDGVATTSRSTFRRECAVSTSIGAPPERVWALLTDGPGFPRWNSTVTGIEGEIAPGARLALSVPVSDRTFRVTVTEFDPPRRMVWADGRAPMFRGVRVYTLEPEGAGTRFTMAETFTGLMVPLVARSLPDFAPVFERYAADLRAAAEAG